MSIGLEAMRQATGTDAISAWVRETLLAAGDWQLVSVSRRYERLEPPDDLWRVYRIRVGRGEGGGGEEWAAPFAESRELRLALHGIFDEERWAEYRDDVLGPWRGRQCHPIGGIGYPVVLDDAQFAVWFYPFDPRLTELSRAADPPTVREFLRRERERIFGGRAVKVGTVTVERLRHYPEINAVLRYDVDLGASTARLFAKALRGDAAERSQELMQQIWSLAELSDGLLRVPRPLGHHPDLGIFLEAEAPGEPVPADRTTPGFAGSAIACAEALAVIHDSNLESEEEMSIEDELARLDGVLEQFGYVHPRAHATLRQLLEQIRWRLARSDEEEELVPTHGDIKYDQFLVDRDGRYTLTDFEYFGIAETSWDLAKFCAHAVPSRPLSWEDSNGAEEARVALLERYLELRPDATLHRFPIYEAVHIANRVMVLMWGQSSGWRDTAETLLVLAMERLTLPAPA